MIKKNVILTALAIAGLAATSLAQTVPSYVPTSGLVGWWPFNGNAIDESINTNDGTVNGATLTTDRFGNANKAYSFDGKGDSILLNLPSMVNYSFNGWLKCSNLPSDYPIIYNFKTSLENNRLHLLGAAYPSVDIGKILIGDDNSINNTYQSNVSLNNDTWRMISIIYDYSQGTLRFFIDNVLIVTKNISGSSNFGGKIKIGNGFSQFTSGNPLYDSKGFFGKLDDIGIWNRALTQQEITNLYNSSSVGLNEFNNSKLFSVYPNPAKHQINIKADASLINSAYSIYDYTGKLILSGKLTSENSSIELTNLAQGIYMLTIGDSNKQTFKLVRD